jgi:hypothetical protein
MNVDVDGVLTVTGTARNQANDAADVAADIPDIADRKTVGHESADDSVLSQGRDLEVFRVVFFKIPLGPRRRFIQL